MTRKAFRVFVTQHHGGLTSAVLRRAAALPWRLVAEQTGAIVRYV